MRSISSLMLAVALYANGFGIAGAAKGPNLEQKLRRATGIVEGLLARCRELEQASGNLERAVALAVTDEVDTGQTENERDDAFGVLSHHFAAKQGELIRMASKLAVAEKERVALFERAETRRRQAPDAMGTSELRSVVAAQRELVQRLRANRDRGATPVAQGEPISVQVARVLTKLANVPLEGPLGRLAGMDIVRFLGTAGPEAKRPDHGSATRRLEVLEGDLAARDAAAAEKKRLQQAKRKAGRGGKAGAKKPPSTPNGAPSGAGAKKKRLPTGTPEPRRERDYGLNGQLAKAFADAELEQYYGIAHANGRLRVPAESKPVLKQVRTAELPPGVAWGVPANDACGTLCALLVDLETFAAGSEPRFLNVRPAPPEQGTTAVPTPASPLPKNRSSSKKRRRKETAPQGGSRGQPMVASVGSVPVFELSLGTASGTRHKGAATKDAMPRPIRDIRWARKPGLAPETTSARRARGDRRGQK